MWIDRWIDQSENLVKNLFNDSATAAAAVHLLKAPPRPVPERKQKCFETNGFLSHDNQTNMSTNAKWPTAVSLRVRDE